MITKKNVNKLQNAVIKENAANLVGAVKLYNALFANGADLKAICKALEIPAEYAVKVAALAKDKKRLVTVCSQMLPKVGDTFVKFTLYSKIYKDSKVNKEKGIESKEVKEVSGALKGMTSKEKVIELSKKGITSKAISEQLKISIRTVQRYLQSAGEGKK